MRAFICSDPQVETHMFTANQSIAEFDAELAAAIDAENQRQEEHIELIASENYASPRVLEAQGSVLTNKYAEGYPGKRYYGGCEHVDGFSAVVSGFEKRLHLPVVRLDLIFNLHFPGPVTD